VDSRARMRKVDNTMLVRLLSINRD